jgi:hypothetical protein
MEWQHPRRSLPRHDEGPRPDGAPTTMIVTRQGLGGAERVWLTFHGALKTTVAMTNPEAAHLAELLTKASGR